MFGAGGSSMPKTEHLIQPISLGVFLWLIIISALFTRSLNWELRREHGVMVLQVKPTPTRFPVNIHYTPFGQRTFAFFVTLVGHLVASRMEMMLLSV